ncbi:MAG: NAD(P)/FAD-dependent oxidoreductase [Candidatus Marinimicrobia bacterium]|jgi:thioredoxin reductase (NADPH)|nr:NAD(P)/FAD-dependent oxidoreductase [Candidatus Neomarinimicrobiota bacterium]MBT3676411.1 NAD(P)/FAD-dependent oxidoreductase [Candidatus Neomarinimicrobiota bacterium]MBT3763976.1 NAD(P)/FAD-dependent oxidoreductase [Candidatus Neomarinimicrobiota bacterium]MBT4270323.1 NAD(P)/FAD-dependent oxidoreductase [Candidatus Neomarinimicrobiota bacterium]MBT4453666.1 NAD(P)/FAD-dependent oxidoreductase [Candidatus Neomarinimicrobiota bacterium]
MKKYDITIIGGGIGGAASALRAGQNGMETLWLLGSNKTRKRSRSQWVMNLDNIVGFHEDVIKNQIIKSLKKNKQDEAIALIENEHYHINNRILIQNTIQRIEKDIPQVTIIESEANSLQKMGDEFVIGFNDESAESTAVILSTGVMDKQPHIQKQNRKGEWEETPKWIYPFANREQVLYCIRCEGHLTKNDSVAIIGQSNTAAELAMMLHERFKNKVYIITNGNAPVISDDRQKILTNYNVEIIEDPIVGLLSEGVKQLHGFEFKSHDSISVRYALVSLGLHRVYNDLARQMNARLMDESQPDEKRHVWIDRKGETSVKGLFAVGDMAKREDEPMMKQVYTAQEYAVRAVDTVDTRRRKAIRKKLNF